MPTALPLTMATALILFLCVLGVTANVDSQQRSVSSDSGINRDSTSPTQGREITVQRDNDQPASDVAAKTGHRDTVVSAAQTTEARSYTEASFLSDAAKLESSLMQSFINESGYELIQSRYDAYFANSTSPTQTDGELVQRLAERIAGKLGRYTQTVQRFRNYVEGQMRSFLSDRWSAIAGVRRSGARSWNDTRQCCAMADSELFNDGFYRSRVARGTSCKLQSRFAAPESFVVQNLTVDVLTNWIQMERATGWQTQNGSASGGALQRSVVKFAHLQTIEGVLQETPARSFREPTFVGALPNDAASNSPSQNAAECARQLSDSRRRDFYFRVMAPRRKAVAFIVDHAAQIRDHELLFLKAAVRFLLHTINENDLVILIALDGTRVRVFDAAQQLDAQALLDNDCLQEDPPSTLADESGAFETDPGTEESESDSQSDADTRPQLVSRATVAVKRQLARIVGSLVRGAHSVQLANSTAAAFDRAFRLLQTAERLLLRVPDAAKSEHEPERESPTKQDAPSDADKHIRVTKIDSSDKLNETQAKPGPGMGLRGSAGWSAAGDRAEPLLVVNYVSRGRLTDMTEHQPVLSRVRAMNAGMFSNRVVVNAYLVQQDQSTQLYEPMYMRSMACQCEPENTFGGSLKPQQATTPAAGDRSPPTGDFVVVNRTSDLFELGLGRSLLRAAQSRAERPLPTANTSAPLALADLFADWRGSGTTGGSAANAGTTWKRGGRAADAFDGVHFTMPFFDPDERSVLLSVGTRVLGVDGLTSVGSVGVDAPLSDAFSDVLFANAYADSRALENACVLYVAGVGTRRPSAYMAWHPALRRTTIDKVPLGVAVEQYEVAAAFRRTVLPALFDSLTTTDGVPRAAAFELDAATARREAALDLQVRDWFLVRRVPRLRITYTWQQVGTTPFVVLTKRFDVPLPTGQAPPPNAPGPSPQLTVDAADFVWHRIDATFTQLGGNPRRTCLLNRQLVTFESSGVFVAPRSFEEPLEYLATVWLAGTTGGQTQAHAASTAASASELAATSSSLTEVRIAQLITESGSSFGAQPFEVALKSRVRADVALSFVLDAHWRLAGRTRGATTGRSDSAARPASNRADDDVWRRLLDDPFSAFTSVRRYFATVTGVVRMYPATPLKRQFDATQRDWFLRASYNPRRLLVTMPFYDPAGAGLVVTMSRAVLERRGADAEAGNETNVVGVIAMDVPVRSVYQRLVRTARHCAQATGRNPYATSGLKETKEPAVRCFLMDEFGYMVVHPRYVFANLTDALLQHLNTQTGTGSASNSRSKSDRERPFGAPEQRHLSFLEPRIANDLLLNHRYAVRKYECRTPLAFDMAGAQARIGAVRDVIQRFYVMNASEHRIVSTGSERSRARSGDSQRTASGEQCLRYSLVRLNGTNLFFGFVNDSCNERDSVPFCPCNTHDHTCILCDRPNEPTECECPCRCPNSLPNSPLPGAPSQAPSASAVNADALQPSAAADLADRCARANSSARPASLSSLYTSANDPFGRRANSRANSRQNTTENGDDNTLTDEPETDFDAETRFGVPLCYATASPASSAFVPVNVREYAYTSSPSAESSPYAFNLGLALGALSAVASNTLSPFLDLSHSAALKDVPLCTAACTAINTTGIRASTQQRSRDACLSLPECEWCEYEVNDWTRLAVAIYQTGRGLPMPLQPANRVPECREQRVCYLGVTGLSPFYLSDSWPASLPFRSAADAAPNAFEQFVFADDFFVQSYMHAAWYQLLTAAHNAYPPDSYPSNVIVNLPSAFAPLAGVNGPPAADSPDNSLLDTGTYARLLPLGPIVGAVMGCIILAGVVVYCYRHYTQERYRHLQSGQLSSSNNSLLSGNARLDPSRAHRRGPHRRGGGQSDTCSRFRSARVGGKRKSGRLSDEECQLDADCVSETDSIGDFAADSDRTIHSNDDVTAKVAVPGIAMAILYETVGVNGPSPLPNSSVQVGQSAVTPSQLVAAVSPYHIHFDGDDQITTVSEGRPPNCGTGGPVGERPGELLTDQSSSVVAVSSLMNDRAEADSERERSDALSPLGGVADQRRVPGPLPLGGGSDLGYSSTILHDGTSSSACRADLERASNVEEPLHGALSKDDGDDDDDVDDDDDEDDEIVPVEDQSLADGDENGDETDGDSRSERTSTVASGSTAKAVVNATSKRPSNAGAARCPPNNAPFNTRAGPYGSPAGTYAQVGYMQPVGHPYYAQPVSSAGCYANPYGVMRPARHQQLAHVLVHRPPFDAATPQQQTHSASRQAAARSQPLSGTRLTKQMQPAAAPPGTQPVRPIFTAPSIPLGTVQSKLPAISEKHALGERRSGEFSATAPIADPNPMGVASQSTAGNVNSRLLEESTTDSGLGGAVATAAQSQAGATHSPQLGC